MAETIVMPKLGMTMTEGTVTKWLKKEGDAVAVGDELFEVETEKLTNIIESTAEGILLKIAVQEGETVECFVPVAYIGQPGESFGEASAPTATASQPPQTPAAAVAAVAAAASGGRIIASPAARKLARENGVDLSQVTAATPGKRIALADVRVFLAKPTVKASGLAQKIAGDMGVNLADVPAPALGRVMAADVLAYAAPGVAALPEERQAMSGMRKVIAKRMRESRDISPDVTYNISVDMTAMKAAKEDFSTSGIKVSYTDLIVKVVAKLLMEFPLLNCSVDGESIVMKRYANIGVAVALPDGLLVPVVKNAHIKGLAAVSAEIKAFAASARDGTLSPDDMTGGTFTITNLGMYGIESFTPIINQPEVAILGVNTMKDSVVVVDGEITVRPVMTFSLVADHRAVDGAVAAGFLGRLRQILEKPATLLL